MFLSCTKQKMFTWLFLWVGLWSWCCQAYFRCSKRGHVEHCLNNKLDVFCLYLYYYKACSDHMTSKRTRFDCVTYHTCVCLFLCLITLMAITRSFSPLSLDTVFPVLPITYTSTHSCVFHYRTRWESDQKAINLSGLQQLPKGGQWYQIHCRILGQTAHKGSAVLNCLNPGGMRKLKIPRLWKFYLDGSP